MPVVKTATGKRLHIQLTKFPSAHLFRCPIFCCLDFRLPFFPWLHKVAFLLCGIFPMPNFLIALSLCPIFSLPILTIFPVAQFFVVVFQLPLPFFSISRFTLKVVVQRRILMFFMWHIWQNNVNQCAYIWTVLIVRNTFQISKCKKVEKFMP